MIPLSVPYMKGNEWKYVKECLDTAWVSTAGTYVDRFETEFCSYTGAAHAVACVNGTAALQVALRLVGLLPGEEVIVPTVTFIATVNAVRYLGGDPVFMDCDDYYNIDVDKPVHIFGNAVRLGELAAVCRDRGIKVVEDAAESLGTFYVNRELQHRHTGTVGDIGCFSFNGNKIITTGGGGMIVTDVPEYAEKAKYLTTQAKDDEVRYIHNEIGYNHRLTNVQAALGVAQLELLPEFLEVKQSNYVKYREGIDPIKGLTLAEAPSYARNNHWMYALQVDSGVYGRDREGLMRHLATHGVQSRPLWYLNHLQAPYRDCRHYRIEKAPRMLETTLNIPCSTNLSQGDIDYVIDSLRNG